MCIGQFIARVADCRVMQDGFQRTGQFVVIYGDLFLAPTLARMLQDSFDVLLGLWREDESIFRG